MSSSWKLEASQTTVAVGLDLAGQRGERRADVAGDGDRLAGGPVEVAEQLDRGRLAVGAGDGDEAVGDRPPGQLELADHLDPALQRGRDHRRLPGHARALDDGPRPLEQSQSIRIQDDFDARPPQALPPRPGCPESTPARSPRARRAAAPRPARSGPARRPGTGPSGSAGRGFLGGGALIRTIFAPGAADPVEPKLSADRMARLMPSSRGQRGTCGRIGPLGRQVRCRSHRPVVVMPRRSIDGASSRSVADRCDRDDLAQPAASKPNSSADLLRLGRVAVPGAGCAPTSASRPRTGVESVKCDLGGGCRAIEPMTSTRPRQLDRLRAPIAVSAPTARPRSLRPSDRRSQPAEIASAHLLSRPRSRRRPANWLRDRPAQPSAIDHPTRRALRSRAAVHSTDPLADLSAPIDCW